MDNIQYILIWIAAHVKTVNKNTSWISPNRKDQPNKEQDKVIGLGYQQTIYKSLLINIRLYKYHINFMTF